MNIPRKHWFILVAWFLIVLIGLMYAQDHGWYPSGV